MKETKGRADGGEVNRLIREKLGPSEFGRRMRSHTRRDVQCVRCTL